MAARARALTAAAGVAVAAAALASATPSATQEAIVFERAGQILAARPGGTGLVVLARGEDPALSPSGARLAFSRGRELFVLELATRKTRRVGPGAEPAWAPDGRLTWVVDGVVHLEGRALGPGTSPAWSADGRLAVVVDGAVVVSGARVASGTSPAWSPDGRLAVVLDGIVHVDGRPIVAGGAPAWSPDARRLVVQTATGLAVVDVETGVAAPVPGSVAGDARPAWGQRELPRPAPPPAPRPDPRALLPDLDQRAPSGLTVTLDRGRFKLGFTSATDNIGRGPLWIRASRPSRHVRLMTANQLVVMRGGGVRFVRDVGRMRYTVSYPHRHWHLLRFQSYELRRASDFDLIVRDRKSGFCLADHYGTARRRVRGFRGPRFLNDCGPGRPDLLTVEHGTSIGYTDRYPAHFHGQNVDITRVPAGVYVLVHRANPFNRIRERTLANNAASLRLALAWPAGFASAPSIRVLRVCERRERC